MEGLITVVVPIYNVEKYLDRCVSSIVNQTYKNLEIVLVDDGSPDRCPQMCDEWAMKDPRIKVIHKQNAGLGFARNTGIENAHGEYICFFDSDDYVELTLIAECYRVAKEEKADIVCFGNDDVTLEGIVKGSRVPAPPQSVYSGAEIREKLIPRLVSYDAKTGEDWKLILSACCSLISMHTVNKAHWRFVSEREIISEDYYSMLELYQHIPKAVFISRVFYHYSVNPVSLSRMYRRDRFTKLKHLANAMKELSNCIDCQIDAEIATMFLGQIMATLRQIVASGEPIMAKKKYIGEIVNDPFLQEQLRKTDFSGDSLTKRLLYWSLRKRSTALCYLFAVARNLKGYLS